MTVDTLIMLAGAFVLVLPQLGFPSWLDTVFLSVVGIFIIALGIIVRRRGNRPHIQPRNGEMFSESASSRHEESAQ